MKKVFLLAFIGLIVCGTMAGSCPQMDDQVTKLKNFDPNYPFPCSYSGYVTVDEPTDSNLFYWLFRDDNFADDAPLVLWINGGPGSTSEFGNLIENGPFKLVREDDSDKIQVHSVQHQAWSSIANMVYLDQPVGVGYSYGHMEITDMSQIQNHTIEFILGLYAKHPELKGRDFFITGESYGGKYQPAMAVGIIDYNERVEEEERIPLKGVLIGNGFTDPITQRLSIRHLATAIGSFQFDSIPQLDTMEQRCHEANSNKDINAPRTCGAVSGFVSTMDGGMDMYDSRWLETNSSAQDELVDLYLNDPDVIRQLHTQGNTKETKFSLGNQTIYDNFIEDGMLRYIDEHQKILDNNITLLLFVGQFDRQDGPYGVQEWMKKLKWDQMDDFHAGSRNLYYYQSDDNDEIRLGGNFKQHKNLNLLMIYAAGHMVPSTQLALSRNMLSDIIYHGGLQCHHQDEKCSLDETTCKLMDNCNGHGVCVTGKCKWDDGFFGADCSISPTELDSETLTLNGTQWVFRQVSSGSHKLQVTSDGGDFMLYTRQGDVPSQTFHNWYVKGDSFSGVVGGETSGEFIALFNPDFDNQITVTLVKTSESSLSPAFWFFMFGGALLALISMLNLVYYLRKRPSKRNVSSLLPEYQTVC